jgi:5-carboxymethyl-2-hydroxymuconate isomerase
VPHIIIECSANVRRLTDLDALVARVHATALETGVFPIGGLRTRVAERTTYRIADGDPANAFVHVTLRIGHGRDLATKQRAAAAIFETLCDALQPAFDAAPLGISLDVQEIDPELSFKKNNLHDYVKNRRAAV